VRSDWNLVKEILCVGKNFEMVSSKKIGIAIHGGATAGFEYSPDTRARYEEALAHAIDHGYSVLYRGNSAIDAVEAAVVTLEDNPLFNAGRGSALNNLGQIEMEAAIMDGKYLHSGAVTMLQEIKNPVSLAKTVLENSNHVMLGGKAATDFGVNAGMIPMTKSYFVSERKYNSFIVTQGGGGNQAGLNGRKYGTVGAVALDKNGNLAAATSTGGITNRQQGRIGHSCIIGAGCYANNETCAVSATGNGEYIIRNVLAYDISALVKYGGKSLQEACDYIIHEKHKDRQGEMGVITINTSANIVCTFNTRGMWHASISTDEPLMVGLYK
jgi:L-asparaginase / beta-aspartyl-peptidase